MTFFIDGPATDSDYQAVRDLPYGKPYREFIEQLWDRYRPSSDPHFLHDAMAHFHQRFWEMYLFCSLLERGLMPKKGGPEGPDFYFEIDSRRYWVEAIAPEPGNGGDRVPFPHVGEAQYVPKDKILLRLTNSLDIKFRNWEKWLRKGIVKDSEGYVIAINARKIPNADLDNEPPYLICAFLPFGDISWTIDKDTLQISGPYFPYSDTINKENKSPVSTVPLLDSKYSPISAILYSVSGFTDQQIPLGKEFSILRNPLARIPLPVSSFGWCRRYRFENDRLLLDQPNSG